jgi:TP901 family phage tail tape measure protein
MQGTQEEIQAISDDIIKASNESGIAAEDLANSVYSAISAGIDQDDAVEFAAKAAKLASAGFTDVDTALTATAKTLNAYSMEASQADEIRTSESQPWTSLVHRFRKSRRQHRPSACRSTRSAHRWQL